METPQSENSSHFEPFPTLNTEARDHISPSPIAELHHENIPFRVPPDEPLPSIEADPTGEDSGETQEEIINVAGLQGSDDRARRISDRPDSFTSFRESPEAPDSFASFRESPEADQLAKLLASQIYAPQYFDIGTPDRSPTDDISLSIARLINHPSLELPDLLFGEKPERTRELFNRYTSSERQFLFCGYGEDELPSQRLRVSPRIDSKALSAELVSDVSYDVDSVIARMQSLMAAKQGIDCLITPAPVMHINTSLHLGTFAAVHHTDDGPKETRRKLNEIPQIVLGQLAGESAFKLTILFPEAVKPEQQLVFLTKEWFRIWMDEIWLVAAYEVLPSSITQQWPASSDHAYANSLKAYMENTRRDTSGVRSRQQLFTYTIQPQYLEPLWARVLELTREPGHHMFREPMIVVSAKNLKHRFHDRSWTGMFERFAAAF